jgi:hypothetical protein
LIAPQGKNTRFRLSTPSSEKSPTNGPRQATSRNWPVESHSNIEEISSKNGQLLQGQLHASMAETRPADMLLHRCPLLCQLLGPEQSGQRLIRLENKANIEGGENLKIVCCSITSVVPTVTCESLQDFWKYRAKCSTINNEVLLEFSDLIWSTFMVEFAHRQKEWIFEKKKLVVEVLLFCPKKKAFLKKRRASFFQKKGLLFDFETPHLFLLILK